MPRLNKRNAARFDTYLYQIQKAERVLFDLLAPGEVGNRDTSNLRMHEAQALDHIRAAVRTLQDVTREA